jgi:hypothetical protein
VWYHAVDVKLPAGGGKKELRIELYDFDSSSDHDFLGALRSVPPRVINCSGRSP